MIEWDQQQEIVTWKAPQKGYFKGKERHFALLTLHIPPRGRHLLRRYGLYSSRSRGTGKGRPALVSRAPLDWYGRQATQPPAAGEPPVGSEVSAIDRRKAGAPLLALIYNVDPFRCPCLRKHDVRDRRYPRSRRDPHYHRLPAQARPGPAR
jgi:hypothetical protein